MPYIHMHSSRKLQTMERALLSQAVGNLIEILPGKSDNGLMLRIDDDCAMRFHGADEADCMYVDVRLYLMTPDDKKKEFADALLEQIKQITGTQPEEVYLSFAEYGNWVARGKMM